MINYTKTTLSRLVEMFNESGYTVRFEKGNFHSGYAIVKNKKNIIINKFFDTEARINTLLELIDIVMIDPYILTSRLKSFYRILVKEGLVINISKSVNEEE